jgi:metal-dependent amidase/aminoacylase/carboxypeptidase family protein
MRSVDKIFGGYDALQADQEAFCKELHQHPEPSHAEHRTAERVAGRLEEYGFRVETGIGAPDTCRAAEKAGRLGDLTPTTRRNSCPRCGPPCEPAPRP